MSWSDFSSGARRPFVPGPSGTSNVEGAQGIAGPVSPLGRRFATILAFLDLDLERAQPH